MSTMSALQLVIMAVVVLAGMAVWLTLVFLADREPRRPRPAPAGPSPGGEAGAAPREGTAPVPLPRPASDERAVERAPEHVAEEGEPEEVPRSRVVSRA